MTRRVGFASLFGLAALLTAHIWAMPLQSALRLHWFSTPDGLFLVGIGFGIGALARFFLRNSAPHSAQTGLSKFTRSNLVCIAFLLLLFLGLVAVNKLILHSFLNSADEHSCYFLAECLRLGKLWIKSHPLQEFFNVVHVGSRDGKWFSVYPLGWPLLWAVALPWGAVDFLNPLMAIFSFYFFYQAGTRVFDRSAVKIGLFIMGISPFFIFTSASYFSHTTCLFMISLFLFAFMGWQNSRSEKERMIWAVSAAAAVGYGLMTRYLTMAAVAGPFLLYHYWPLLRGRKQWRPSDWAALTVMALFSAAILLQNYLVTGKPFKAPNKYDKSWERLGFRDDYTPMDGLNYIIARIFYLMDWFAPPLVVFFLYALFKDWKNKDTPLRRLMRWGFFYPVVAYFFYYSWGGNQYGPRYYYEGFPFLCLALGDFIKRQWAAGNAGRKKFIVGILCASLATNGYLFFKQGVYFEKASSQRRALYDLAERELQNPAIVFIQGFLGDHLVIAEEDAVRNPPLLNSRILYAHDLGERNHELKAYYPDREYYRGTYDRTAKAARLEKL